MNPETFEKLKSLLGDYGCCLCCDGPEWRVVEMSESDKPGLRGAGMWWPSEPILARGYDIDAVVEDAYRAKMEQFERGN